MSGDTIPNMEYSSAILIGDSFCGTGVEMDEATKAAFMNGVTKARAGDLAGATAAFTEAVDREPGWTQARLNRGVAWFLAKNYPAALSDFDMVLAADPNSVDALLNRSAAKRHGRRCGGRCGPREGRGSRAR